MYATVILAVVLTLSFCGLFTSGLQKDFDYTWDQDKDTGHLSVSSAGRFADVVFLDEEDSIKKLKCEKWKLIVIGKNTTSVGKNWTKGQIIIGGPRWDCFLNSFGLEQKGIMGRIVHVNLPHDGRTDIFLESVQPLDILVEATISVKYSPVENNSRVETEKKSSFLYLDSRDLATCAEGIHTTDTKYITKVHGRAGLDIQSSKNSHEENLDMSMKLTNCLKKSEITYHMKMILNRNESGHAEIKLLQNQIQMDYKSHFTTELDISSQMMANDTFPISEQLQRKLITIPVVEATKGLPTIMLNVLVSTDTRLKTHILARAGQSHVTASVVAASDIIFSLNENDGTENPVKTTAKEWTLERLSDEVTDAEQHLQANIEVFHRFSVESQLSVLMEDMYPLYNFQMNFSVSPTINVKSWTTDVARKVDLISSLVIYTNNSHGEDRSQRVWLGEKTLQSNAKPACNLSAEWQGTHLSMDDVCGKMVKKITRGDSNFKKLHQIHGDFILFASEEAGESWCGRPNRKCINCTHQIAGNNDDAKCADRMMTSQMALLLSKMAEMANYTWPNRKLVVLEAWDEGTSKHPNGSHGESSPFYEGRAAYVALSQPIPSESDQSKQTTKLDRSESILGILGRLATCSGFPFVRQETSGGYIEVAVKSDSDLKSKSKTSTLHEDIFESAIKEEDANIAVCDPILKAKFPNESFPHNQNEVDVCGAADSPIKRNDIDQYSKLYEYPFDDVIFAKEGDPLTWCGTRMRRCSSECNSKTGSSDLWQRCSTRVMTPRLATRLRNLANLVKVYLKRQSSTFIKAVIKVEIGHKEPKEIEEQHLYVSNLYTEGRGLRLSVIEQKYIDLEKLSMLSICAGFDSVIHTNNNYIEVFVKKQVGFLPTVVNFLNTLLLAVEPPPADLEEYALPESLANEDTEIPLFDGSDRSVALSQNFQIGDFVYPGFRYFRLDPLLVSCLESTQKATSVEFRILPGSSYRTATTEQVDGRHHEESVRFRIGQAVEIKTRDTEDLVELAQTAVRSCGMTLVSSGRAMGIGLHVDYLYLDIRPISGEQFVILWNSGGNFKMYDRLKAFINTAQTGGSIIQSFDSSINCEETPLGPDLYYLALDEDSNFCKDSDHKKTCSTTKKRREEESKSFVSRLISAAGISALHMKDVGGDTRKCLVTQCGGCSGFGSVWVAKMKACAGVIHTFIKKASRPFPELKDRVSFYNSGATYSKIHHLACDGESLCIDEIPLYAMLVPLFESKFTPEDSVTVEELLFGEDNPSPLLQIVEQELAMNAVGDVSVFIESEDDLSILRNVIKILMVYNSKVDNVRFFLTDDVSMSTFFSSFRRKLGVWSGSVCPKYSRLTVTPYTVKRIPSNKQRRSIEGSQARNERKLSSKNWEIQWLESL